MWQLAVRAVFYSCFCHSKIPAAFIAQCIQRAVAEQTVEVLRICACMTRKIFTFLITEKSIVFPFPIWFFHLLSPHFQECLCILAARCASCNAWHTSSAHLCNPAGGYIRWGIDSHHWYWFVARHLQRWDSSHIWYKKIQSRHCRTGHLQNLFQRICDTAPG